MKKVNISVIVVTYNQEATIARTLDSILRQQTSARFEIVIGDDCSSDATEAICRDYASRYPDIIRYLRRDRNLGVTGNYFDCIREANGRFLADCAGDDYWVDDCKLEKQFQLLISNPDVSLVGGLWVCRDETTGEITPAPNGCPPGEYAPGQLIVPLITHSKVVHLCSALYRRSIIIDYMEREPQLMMDPSFCCEDIQILLACAHEGRVVVIPDLVLHYSVGHDSISHRTSYLKMYRHALANYRQLRRMQKGFVPHPTAEQKRELRLFNRKERRYIAILRLKSLLTPNS